MNIEAVINCRVPLAAPMDPALLPVSGARRDDESTFERGAQLYPTLSAPRYHTRIVIRPPPINE